jgi:hypothetical protein
MFIVDHLLDILTGNEHRKTSHYIAEQKMLRREDELLESTYTELEELEQPQTKAGQVSWFYIKIHNMSELKIDHSVLTYRYSITLFSE